MTEQEIQKRIDEESTEKALNMIINGELKQCKVCKIAKPQSEFYKSRNNSTSTKNTCKDCYNERRRIKAKSYSVEPLEAVGDRKYKEAEITLHNYKEPLTKVEDGHGYYGTVAATEDGKYIQCHICGGLFANMGNHLNLTHKMNGKEYKKKFGLKSTTALISENERMRLKNKTLQYLKKMTDEEKEEFKRKAKEAYARKGYKKRGAMKQPKATLEQMNERGACPDQVLAKVVDISKKIGRTPTKAEFIKACGTQRYTHLIYKLFGSWTLALELVGLDPKAHAKLPKEYKKLDFSDDYLLDELRDYALMHGVEPTTSDFKRGVLPPLPLYIQRFGSLPLAYKEAELSDILDGQIGGHFDA